jgi:hypothetical protein
MLKIANLTFALLLLTSIGQLTQAQAPMSSYDYYNMRQVIVNSAMANKANGAASSETTVAVANGEKRIKAGKANLTFTPTQAGLERFTKGIQFEPDEPQTLPEQIIYAKNYVKRFNEMLTAVGGKINNCADAYVYAYAVSYMAYYGKNPDIADIKSLKQKYTQENMNSEYFQGLSDADRQWFYNSWALMSLQAIDEREKANRATSSREREKAVKKAKEFAKSILEIK